MTLILSNEEIAQILTMRTCLEALEEGYREQAEGWAEHEKLPLIENVIADKIQGRTSADQITMFRSGSGMGLQFAAVGAQVYRLAKERGLGLQISTEWFTQTLHT